MTLYDDARTAITAAESQHEAALAEATGLLMAEKERTAALVQALDAALAQVADRDATIAEQAADLEADEVQIDDLIMELGDARARIAELEALLNPGPSPAIEAFGVVTPWQIPDYDDVEAVFAHLVRLGVKTIRGRWRTGGKGDQVMSLCAQHGIKWLVTFIPEAWCEAGAPGITASTSTLAQRMRAALSHPDAASVVIGVENANEPNHVRGGGTPLADWPQRCAAWGDKMMQILDELGLFLVPVLSPAMHDEADDNVNGAHWQALADAGCNFDVVSMHAYPKGKEATNLLAERLGRVNAAFPDEPTVWLTEFGWMTNPDVNGPAYTDPETAADYLRAAPEALYEFGGQVERFFYYELIGSDRGIVGVPAMEAALTDLLT